MILDNIQLLKDISTSLLDSYASTSNTYNELISKLASRHRIAIIGTGKSYGVAYRCADTGNSLGLDMVALHANDLIHGSFGALANCDGAIYLSKSGSTEETINAILYAQDYVQYQCLLTMGSPEGGLPCEIIRFPEVREMTTTGGCNLAPTTSCLLFGYALDMIICEASDYNNTDFKLMHPGGAIGRNNN